MVLIPFISICLFILLYVLATINYTGGSNTDKYAKNFSWLHNYWCDLLASESKNGITNSARPVAITALFVLGIGLGIFWYNISLIFKSKWLLLIRYCGMLSVLPMVFLYAGPHDLVINISGLLGVTAITGLLAILYNEKWYALFSLGIFCMILALLNNYIYYTLHFLYALPAIQKVTFLIFLLWFYLVNLTLYKKVTTNLTIKKQEFIQIK